MLPQYKDFENLYVKVSKATICCQLIGEMCVECPYFEIAKENDDFENCQAQHKKDLDKVLEEDLPFFIDTLERCSGYDADGYPCLECPYGHECLDEFCVGVLHEHASYLIKALIKRQKGVTHAELP